jgi:hypothetical protein
MHKYFKLFSLVAMVSIVAWGCTPPEGDDNANGTTASVDQVVAAVFCGKCGHAKGTEQCCAEDGEACAACGMHKGSSLCCVELADDAKGKDLCGKCGQVAGTDACCAEGAKACAACGLHKGSPLCCKLNKAEEAVEETTAEPAEETTVDE